MKLSEVEYLVRIDGQRFPGFETRYHVADRLPSFAQWAQLVTALCGESGLWTGWSKVGETGLFDQLGASTCTKCLERLEP